MLKFIFFLLGLIPLIFLKDYLILLFSIFFCCYMYMYNLKMTMFNYSNLGNLMGEDLISYLLILLSFWISSLMILSSYSIFRFNYYGKFMLFLIVLTMLFLFFSFSVLNLFMFYLFFESSLIPVMFIILGFGYQPERLRAGIYMLFYTLFASLPLLGGMFFVSKYGGSLIYLILSGIDLIYYFDYLFYIMMVMAFMIKLPLFCFHFWLPKAHVEAPVSGSMILAGVLLKLGGYGLYRVNILIYKVGIVLNFYFILISLVGGFLVSLLCLRQNDVKSLIAYSSVVHMGLLVCGLLTLKMWGLCGAMILMIAHGLCSSGLFCLVNMNYERLGSRSMFLNSGMINMLPNFAFWWFIFCIMNMAAPPSMNLLGEIGLLNSVVSWSLFSMIGLMLMSFFSASYSLYLYSSIQHGKMFYGFFSFSLGYVNEYLILFLHFIPLIFFVLNSGILFNLMF